MVRTTLGRFRDIDNAGDDQNSATGLVPYCLVVAIITTIVVMLSMPLLSRLSIFF